ncbi:MAG: nucleotide sugar dehydrogenase [Kiloniellaceae bacterium]
MEAAARAQADEVLGRIQALSARIGVIGVGYVGLPLACAFAAKGFPVVGFDADPKKVETLRAGASYIEHIPSETIRAMIDAGAFEASGDFARLSELEAILICVPTPLTRDRRPDMRFVEGTAETVARYLRKGQLVVLESTTYPGTTAEVLRPILEGSGLVSERDFFLAYAPEREDPGNETHSIGGIPKVIGGDGPFALKLATALYDQVVVQTVPVSSTRTAEAVKLTENIFRAVNIALVNELKIVFNAMGIDVWAVIEAAKTKPFGYMPFYPGPGLGGHCIPIDPFYLSWKAREYGITTRFIELAGEINSAMPNYVIERLAQALNDRFGDDLKGARILMIGMAYKKNVDDTRESPALALTEMLEARSATVDFHDPHVARIPVTRAHPRLAGRRSTALDAKTIAAYDAVLICTDHDDIDYRLLVDHGRLVIDTRNALGRARLDGPNVVKA